MTEDSKLYSASKDFVVKSLSGYYNRPGKTLILSISRKGPKFLERLFGRVEGETLNTITEVALPFCAVSWASEKYDQVLIFDDAVYYGTTAEGIYKELEGFERLYGVNTEKKLYTAIRSRESKSNLGMKMGEVEIHSYNDDTGITLRPGYGHFFIRNLEKDLGQLHNTLEVEFPIVEFKSTEPIDQESLFAAIREYYGNDITFEVGHYDRANMSVILDKDENISGQSFRKMRIYVDGNVVRVVCMAPWMIPNDMSVMLGLFDNSDLNTIWMRLMKAYTHPVEDIKKFKVDYFLSIERSIRKSLAIMANYLFSFRVVIEEKHALSVIFGNVCSGIRYSGVQRKDLFYLLGDAQLCDDIIEKLKMLWEKADEIKKFELVPNIKLSGYNIDYQVFESDNFPESKELQIFQRHNGKMLEGCQDVNEALSAMFFNQTALIEKWSRRNEKYDFGRLRFGYTYNSLYRDLIDVDIMEPLASDKKAVHRWIDNRIEQACVVPQYVVDRKTSLWSRVFRPGENEDALLSHLARYVLAIFKMADSIQGLGWLYENYLREILCLSVLTIDWDWQKDTFEFELVPDLQNRTLMLKYEGQKTSKDVLDYIIAMGILKLDNGMVTISDDLADDEICEVTTLDQSVVDSIRLRITDVARKVKDYKYQNFTFFVTNLYFFHGEDLDGVKKLNLSLETALSDMEMSLATSGVSETIGQQIFKEYYRTKQYIIGHNLLEDRPLMASIFPDESNRRDYIREMVVLWILKSLFELLIVSFLRNDTEYLAREVDSSLTAFPVYGHTLGLSKDDREHIRLLLDQRAPIERIRRDILTIVRKHIDNIGSVDIKEV